MDNPLSHLLGPNHYRGGRKHLSGSNTARWNQEHDCHWKSLVFAIANRRCVQISCPSYSILTTDCRSLCSGNLPEPNSIICATTPALLNLHEADIEGDIPTGWPQMSRLIQRSTTCKSCQFYSSTCLFVTPHQPHQPQASITMMAKTITMTPHRPQEAFQEAPLISARIWNYRTLARLPHVSLLSDAMQ